MKTVLVVGREWRFRALLRAQLRQEGYEALGWESLEDAEQEVRTAASRPAALVFDTTDVSLAQAEPKLRAWGERLPVLVITGAGQRLEAESVRVLSRPLRIEDVVAAIKEMTGPRR